MVVLANLFISFCLSSLPPSPKTHYQICNQSAIPVLMDSCPEIQSVHESQPRTTTKNHGDKPKDVLDAKFCRPLYTAALKGDWKTAESFLKKHPQAITARFTERSMTALHVAAMEGHSGFLEKLIEIEAMTENQVGVQDGKGYTALHYAAIDGNIRSVKALLLKNRASTQAENKYRDKPLLCAIDFARGEKEKSRRKKLEEKEVIWLLSLVTIDNQPGSLFGGDLAETMIFYLTSAAFYDISLSFIKIYQHFATEEDMEEKGLAGDLPKVFVAALDGLATNPGDFPSGRNFGILRSCIYHFVHVELNSTPPNSMRTEDIEILLQNKRLLGSFMHLVDKPTITEPGTLVNQVVSWIRRILSGAIEVLLPCTKNVRDAKLRHQYAAELLRHICEQLSQFDYQDLTRDFSVHKILDRAACLGIAEIIKACLRTYPEMVWDATILETAILERREKVINLMIHNASGRNNKILANKVSGPGNILHATAKLAPPSQLSTVSGSAFQIQRELQWFKGMEELVDPRLRAEKNEDFKLTPWEVFLGDHGPLIEKGEQWMKDTSNYCMLVSTLIATVVFAAAFTVPGGNGSDGLPVFLNETSFTVFAVSVALALFSAVISLLMFLSILTSRFAPEDFLKSLPKRLIFGLASLFFSIAAMMVAFGATLTIFLGDRWTWVPIPVTLLASFPVILFIMLQLPLFYQMCRSTFRSSIFHPENIW